MLVASSVQMPGSSWKCIQVRLHRCYIAITSQEQYLVHWKPSAIEKWALQYHMKSFLKYASKIPTARKNLQDPCCEICWTLYSKEKTDEVQSNHEQGMFQCSTCIRTHHWDCLMQLGCYHNHAWCPPMYKPSEERHCPACRDLSEEQRKTWRTDGQRAKHGWSTGSQHGKQQRWSDPALIM